MNSGMMKMESAYGDTAVRLALYQLLNAGKRTVVQMDLETSCAEAHSGADQNPLVTPEMQEQIIRCLNALAQLEPDDIFAYVKTKLLLPGITVHEGKNICVRWNGTDDLILYCTVPSDTDDELIEAASEKLDELVEAYSSENDEDGAGFDYVDAIWNAFRSVGIYPHITAADRTIYV